MDIVLTDIQQVALSLKPVSKAGNPAPIDGTPSWNSSDPTVIVVLAPDPDTPNDPTTAKAVTTGKLGTAQITATADADLGEGVRTINSEPLNIDVRTSEASGLSVSVGIPTERA